MSKPEYVLSVDARKMSCPLPILKLKKAVDTMEIGQVMELVATDPGIVADMEAWARQTGHEIVFNEQQEKEYYYYVNKTH